MKDCDSGRFKLVYVTFEVLLHGQGSLKETWAYSDHWNEILAVDYSKTNPIQKQMTLRVMKTSAMSCFYRNGLIRSGYGVFIVRRNIFRPGSYRS